MVSASSSFARSTVRPTAGDGSQGRVPGECAEGDDHLHSTQRGQLTNQAVPPDEHPWIEDFGATASYRALRRGIREYYRLHLPLTSVARADIQVSVNRTEAEVSAIVIRKWMVDADDGIFTCCNC